MKLVLEKQFIQKDKEYRETPDKTPSKAELMKTVRGIGIKKDYMNNRVESLYSKNWCIVSLIRGNCRKLEVAKG